MKDASIVRIRPKKGKGKGEMVPLETKTVSHPKSAMRRITDRSPTESPSQSINSSISETLTSGRVRSFPFYIVKT
jgi:hypothetical protein